MRSTLRRLILALVCCAWAQAAETAAAAPATAATPAIVTIRNAVAEADIALERGGIRRFVLLGQKPVRLPEHLQRFAAKQPEHGLAVLDRFNADGEDHLWLNRDRSTALTWGLGQKPVPWTVVSRADDEVVLANGNGDFAHRLVYRMHATRPTVEIEVRVANRGAQKALLAPRIESVYGVHNDYGPGESYNACIFWQVPGEDKVRYEALPAAGVELPVADQTARFVGLRSRFFAGWWTPGLAGVVPAGGEPDAKDEEKPTWKAKAVGFANGRQEHQARVHVAWDKVEVGPGQDLVQQWTLTASGMSKAELAVLTDEERHIEFTDWMYRFFKVLAKGMTWVLDQLVAVVVNYGVAVIILTFVIKLALYRTTFKQHESMMKMQKLAPEIKYIQEQYKTDKQKQALKQMELFKKHGVNPLGGCLPMLIQIPIFIALFQAFNHSADMRGASFLWIHDLTLPDAVWCPPVSWWPTWLGLNPLPIIYIATTIWMTLQQKAPVGGDPAQEQMFKIIRWMPVLFGVIFYNMPSGLVLYFTVQSVISTIEIKIIKKKLGM